MGEELGVYRAYGALLVMAVLPIVAGAHSSLRMPKEAKKRLRLHEGVPEQQHDDEDEDEEIERLGKTDAYMFPILGSVVLFCLYCAFTYLPKVWINRIIGGYMGLMSIGAAARMAVTAVQTCMSEKSWRGISVWKLTLDKNKAEYSTLSANGVHLAATGLAIILAITQHTNPHWAVSNLLALSFAFNAISLLRLDSFFTGSALLALLFIYDIWWVFGSKAVFGADVMVTVATNLEAPIKVTFPRDLAAGKGFSLLGLGDIVLPGIFVALALRYDYHRAIKANPPPRPSSNFARPYFYTVLVAYISGLVTTVAIMHTFRAAQPALLYLSPACIGSVVLCALMRGELSELWAFDDASDDEKPSKKDESAAGKKGAVEKEELRDEVEGALEMAAESTSVEVEGQRVLRSRAVKQ